MSVFPTLFSLDKNGKTKEWKIQVENRGDHSVITYSYGYIDGKKIEYNLMVSEGKNKGKKNETTHYSQACLDAESRWKKKKTIDKYVEILETSNALESTDEIKKNREKLINPNIAYLKT
jgi:hypothetical protein